MVNILNFSARRKATKAQEYQTFVRPMMPLLFRKAYEYCGTHEAAEDLVQEVLTELFVNFDAFNAADAPKAFALRCLYFRFVDSYRKKKKLPDWVSFDDADQHTALVEDDGPMEKCLRLNALSSLEILTPPQRACVIMHDIEGYTLNELEPMLNIPVGTLKSHLHRARKKLKNHMALQPSSDDVRFKEQEGNKS